MDACIIECTTLHKLIGALFLEAATADVCIENPCGSACLESIANACIVLCALALGNGQTHFVLQSAE